MRVAACFDLMFLPLPFYPSTPETRLSAANTEKQVSALLLGRWNRDWKGHSLHENPAEVLEDHLFERHQSDAVHI